RSEATAARDARDQTSLGAPTEAEAPADAQPRGARDPRLGRVYDRVLEAYGEISVGTAADKALGATFRRARDLGGRERAEVGDLVYALVRTERATDDLLDRALKAEGKKRSVFDAPILVRLRVLTYLASHGTPIEELAARDAYAFKRVPGLFERIAKGRVPAAKRTPLEALAIELSLPDWMTKRLVDAFGEEKAIAMAKALDGRAPVTLRVNVALATRDDVRARIAKEHGIEAVETKLSPHGLILPGPVDLPSWDLFQEGLVELQDEGSQLVALATGARPKDVVLDACAGAGGKTLAIAAEMRGTGRLVALDHDGKKLEVLKKRARRAKLTSTEALVGDLQGLPKKLIGGFSRVLLDAPCTGTGVLRRHPDAKWRLTEEDVDAHVARQGRMIASAATALEPGGVLVYATCSILREENEDVVNAALAADARLDPLPLAETWGPELSKQLGASWMARVGPGPSASDPDGFFVATMRRK
ncbi:RsmB/NOP family class I SAM-dependent RNA methyltransferase, partial [Myxococcota bacterium]|nr:RsmB/NOP family class I SAM-dependent RNA methyltransferase [Myxococcota bacterium]